MDWYRPAEAQGEAWSLCNQITWWEKNAIIECIELCLSSGVFKTLHNKILLISLSSVQHGIPVTDTLSSSRRKRQRLLLTGVIAAQRWQDPCQKQADWSHERFAAAPEMTANTCYFVWCWDRRGIKRLMVKNKQQTEKMKPSSETSLEKKNLKYQLWHTNPVILKR